MKKEPFVSEHISPKGLKRDEYDVVIVGGGIGGLVCGCYLAKAGKNVLIAEKNNKLGGYCISFERSGILFDACIHSIGSCRKGGVTTSILEELGIKGKIKFLEKSPTKTIISDGKEFSIDRDVDSTIKNLIKYFPKSKNDLEIFFKAVTRKDYLELAAKSKKLTFEKFFKAYVADKELNNLFSFLIFQSAGLPSSLISAFMGLMLFREYILDGGYYPEGGMQKLPDVLRDAFLGFGGKILLNYEVKEITPGEKITLSIGSEGKKIRASVVVSNADVVHTLRDLIGMKETQKPLTSLLKMAPSLSSFILYLKLKSSKRFPPYVHYVSLKGDFKENVYLPLTKSDFKSIYLDCFFNTSNDSNIVTIPLFVPFNNREFWKKNKAILTEKIITEFLRKTGLGSNDIEVKEIATPLTLQRYTHAYKGANFGWAPTVTQAFPQFDFKIDISNIYFVGHWLGRGHGISTVAYLGKRVANKILAHYKK